MLHRSNSRTATFAQLCAVTALLTAGAARAEATIVVDTAADGLDGVCTTDGASAGTCNLRAAFALAATTEGDTTITLGADATIDNGEIVVAAGAGRVTVLGASGKTIRGNGGSRFLQIQEGARVALDGVTITGFSNPFGGAVVNSGELSLARTTFTSNTARCFATGAMTANATCGAGAISNAGTLTLGDDTLFENNIAESVASSAAFTTSSATAGAIGNSSTLTFDGSVVFRWNLVRAEASSGFHPMPGGAFASSAGGAIFNGGTLDVTANGAQRCRFQENDATAQATTPGTGDARPTSRGGAIAGGGGTMTGIDTCKFQQNGALTEPNVSPTPAN
jgi:hypothetical protein